MQIIYNMNKKCKSSLYNCSNKKREQTQTLKKLIRKTKQITRNKKNVISSAKEKSLQDTIIILSDNESESNNKADENNCKKKKKTNKN